jgi:hypothetical protein
MIGLIVCTRYQNIWECDKCAAINICIKFYLYLGQKALPIFWYRKTWEEKNRKNDYMQDKTC